MSFQIKDFNSITLGMINHARSVTSKVTDYQPGSVVRTIMEAPAVELEELYLQMFFGLRDAIPEATFLSFGFDRLPAVRATGYVSVSIDPAMTDDFLVEQGTVFESVDGRTYTSTEAVVWAAGEPIVRIPVTHSTAGLSGNISAGLITLSPTFNDQFTISNSAIETGRDPESDREREARFAEFIQSISRGTVLACMYAARLSRVLDADGNLHEYVTRSGLLEEQGYVRIYLYSSRGVPSSELLADGQTRIDGVRDDDQEILTAGYRPAGVRVDVLPMVERSISMSIKVGMQPGRTLTTAVEQRIGDIFGKVVRTSTPGATLFLGTLVEKMLAVDGVETIVPVSSSNILCAVDEALVPGTLTIAPL